MQSCVARHFQTGDWIQLQANGSVIETTQAIGEQAEASPEQAWLLPMMFDLQINGVAGREFIAPDMLPDELAALFNVVPSLGVDRFLPTLTTQDHDWLANSLNIMAAAFKSHPELDKLAVGLHLEGPYISPIEGPRGAHPEEHCRKPSWDEFELLQYRSGGRIKLLTMSPEYSGSADFIKQVVSTGVKVAIGHTNATGEQIQAAVDAGATLSTHLGNGAHALIKRHPNYIWEQLAEDRLSASLIADGHHLPSSVLKCFARIKSSDKIVLVSDMTGLSSVPPGEYVSHTLGAVEVLSNGKLVVAGQRDYLAGASKPLFFGMSHMFNHSEATIQDVFNMATRNPAALLGQPTRQLVAGEPANWLEVKETPKGDSVELTLERIVYQGKELDKNELLVEKEQSETVA